MNIQKECKIYNIIVILLLMIPSILVGQSSQRMRIKTVIGKAEVRSVNGQWRPVRVNAPIKEGWDIRTYVESSVEIEFSTGTLLRIGEKSAFNLSRAFEDGEQTKSHVKIYTGKVWGNVKRLVGKNSSFDFETPTAVASIRGTRLGIAVSKKGTLVDVYEGAVSVKRKGEGKGVLVKTRNRAVVAKDKEEVTLLSFKKVAEKEDRVVDPFKKDEKEKPSSDSTSKNVPDADTLHQERGESINTSEDSSNQQNEIPVEKENQSQSAESNNSVEPETMEEQNKRPLHLLLKTPQDGSVVKKPIILLTGVTSPGATVLVDNTRVRVAGGGTFTHQIHIPDEQGEINFEVVARLEGEEKVISRMVSYQPDRRPLSLSIQSPTDGQLWDKPSIRVIGKTGPKATVRVNDKPAVVTPAGIFTSTLRLTEKDLSSDFTIDIEAGDGYDQVDKSINLTLDIRSMQLNTSRPSLTVTGKSQQATRSGELTLQVTDRTPGDQVRIEFENGGSPDEFILEPNGFERINLEEGKNTYSSAAYDLAGNRSNIVRGEIYYLPGPLTIHVQEPFENPLIIDDLPPMPHNVGAMRKDIELEIDDGIGTVPETIRYVKVKGPDGEQLLKHVNRYTYRGTVTLIRGSNIFTVMAEDLAGNSATEQIKIVVNR